MAAKRYRRPMTTWDAIRRAIRRGRQDRNMSLDALAAKSEVTKRVLHQIEKVEKYPNYNPTIETVIKLVEDGFELTLCSFVCWAEGEAGPSFVGLPEMPADLRGRALRIVPPPPPTEPPSGSTPATSRANRNRAVLTRHR
jgi:transcriptional regulator with XRE-family HTH domain